MKNNIHPPYKRLLVKISGDTFEVMSTYPGDEVLMDVDYRTHPAWTGKGRNVFDTSNKDINEFNNRFPGLFTTKK